MDWKRTANLDRKYVNPWRSVAAPLEHLADAQGVKIPLAAEPVLVHLGNILPIRRVCHAGSLHTP